MRLLLTLIVIVALARCFFINFKNECENGVEVHISLTSNGLSTNSTQLIDAGVNLTSRWFKRTDSINMTVDNGHIVAAFRRDIHPSDVWFGMHIDHQQKPTQMITKMTSTGVSPTITCSSDVSKCWFGQNIHNEGDVCRYTCTYIQTAPDVCIRVECTADHNKIFSFTKVKSYLAPADGDYDLTFCAKIDVFKSPSKMDQNDYI